MGNHYHLCFETRHPNLVEGMRWLQSTYANRFNRFRKSNGHVFQGRYKALLLDSDALGAVCHYIHLEHSAFSLTNWLDRFSRLSKAVEAEAVREPCCFDQRR